MAPRRSRSTSSRGEDTSATEPAAAQLVDTLVQHEAHVTGALDQPLSDADRVVEPAVALVLRLEPEDDQLRTDVIAEDGAALKQKRELRAIVRGEDAAATRQHATVAPPAGVIRPADGSGEPLSGHPAPALAGTEAPPPTVRAPPGQPLAARPTHLPDT